MHQKFNIISFSSEPFQRDKIEMRENELNHPNWFMELMLGALCLGNLVEKSFYSIGEHQIEMVGYVFVYGWMVEREMKNVWRQSEDVFRSENEAEKNRTEKEKSKAMRKKEQWMKKK